MFESGSAFIVIVAADPGQRGRCREAIDKYGFRVSGAGSAQMPATSRSAAFNSRSTSSGGKAKSTTTVTSSACGWPSGMRLITSARANWLNGMMTWSPLARRMVSERQSEDSTCPS